MADNEFFHTYSHISKAPQIQSFAGHQSNPQWYLRYAGLCRKCDCEMTGSQTSPNLNIDDQESTKTQVKKMKSRSPGDWP